MKVLITGATGLIGSALSKHLISKGYEVHFLTTSHKKREQQEKLKGFYWNPSNNQIDLDAFLGVDVIVHLAGASISKRWTSSYKIELLNSRIKTADLIYNTLALHSHQVKHFISASGTAIYPESINQIYDESSTEHASDFLASVVQKWELSANRFSELGIKVSKLRTGVVFARQGGAFPQIAKPIRYGFGAVMGNGEQIQSWIHLEDLISMYRFIIENENEGVFNAVAPELVSNKQLTVAIANKVQKPLWLPNIPQFMMKLILGEMSILLFTSKKLSSKKIQDLGFHFKYPTLKEALESIV